MSTPDLLNTQLIKLSWTEVLYPVQITEIKISPNYSPDLEFMIEPRVENKDNSWLPQHCRAVGRFLRVSNTSDHPIRLSKDSTLLQIRPIIPSDQIKTAETNSPSTLETTPDQRVNKQEPEKPDSYLSEILINEQQLDKHQKQELLQIHKEYHSVFDNDMTGGYNGNSGPCEANFNSINNQRPPANKCKVPQYAKQKDLQLLLAYIDKLEAEGVVARATEIGVIPEFASPCMLVQKTSARSLEQGALDEMQIKDQLRYYRFVLAFNQLNQYIKTQPAKHVDIQQTIRKVGQSEVVIAADLTASFFQRNMSTEKLPWMAFVSPFKGTFIIRRSAQGLTGQSEGLQELTSQVLGHLLAEGRCEMIHDNLYVLGNTIEECTTNWRLVLAALSGNNLKLSPHKTFCFTATLDLLGWTKKEKPTITCIQQQLNSMIDTMLVELDPENNSSRVTAQRIAVTGTKYQQKQYQNARRGQSANRGFSDRGQRRAAGRRGSGATGG